MEVQLVVQENPDVLKAAIFIAALALGIFSLAGLFFVISHFLLHPTPNNLFNGYFQWRQFLLNIYNLLLAVVLAIPEIKPAWATKSQQKLFEQAACTANP